MNTSTTNPPTDESLLAALDIEYQAAVQNNDAATMDRLLTDDFVLIVGNGTVYTKADLLKEAREEAVIYERQEAAHRTVRRWGDTAVVTALLWVKGTQRGTPLHFKQHGATNMATNNLKQIEVENVNHPGQVRQVNADLYQAMKRAFLKVLPLASPGLTLAEIQDRLLPQLPDELFPAGAKAGWWAKTVQLDLEAKGLIVREKTRPLRLHKAAR